jgi:HAD domain in Swiss Army Knife RNA repair proteins
MTNSAKTFDKPVLFVDIDGVISLFGFPSDRRPPGTWLNVDGVLHLISATASEHLLRLARTFDLVWCSGWEDKADEHLVHALHLPARPPFLTFSRPSSTAHWKLGGVGAHAGDRPAAWIDDAFDDECRAWAAARSAPTLLVATDPAVGLTAAHVATLEEWARERLAPFRAAMPSSDEPA